MAAATSAAFGAGYGAPWPRVGDRGRAILRARRASIPRTRARAKITGRFATPRTFVAREGTCG